MFIISVVNTYIPNIRLHKLCTEEKQKKEKLERDVLGVAWTIIDPGHSVVWRACIA